MMIKYKRISKGGVTIKVIATTSEMEKHFGKYLQMVIDGCEVIVTKDGQEVGRFVSEGKTGSYLTDSLTGILKGNCEGEDVREESLRAKYDNTENERQHRSNR